MRRTGDRPVASYDNKRTYNLHTLYSCRSKNNTPIKVFLALLNSELFNFIYKQKLGTESGRVFAEIKILYVRKLPVVDIPLEKQKSIAEIVDKIIEAKKQDANADTKELEDKIDCLVYKLYGLTDEEIAIVEGREEK